MDQIKLSRAEKEEMRQFYQEELDKTVRRLEHIKDVLQKLGFTRKQVEAGVSGANREVGKTSPLVPSASSSGDAPAKKRGGRKSKWEPLIEKALRDKDQPLTYDQLTAEIMASSDIPNSKKASTRQAIVSVLFRLRSQDGDIKTFALGTREKYIGLTDWTDSRGKLKKEYRDKLELPQSKKPTKRRKKRTTRKKK